MKIVLDSGPLISLSNTCLLWLLERLPFRFVISPAVLDEVVTTPYKTKHHLLSAVRIKQLVENGTVSVYSSRNISKEAEELLSLANSIFRIGGRKIRILHRGEAEALALALHTDRVLCIDERTTRLLIEDPLKVKENLETRLAERVYVHRDKLDELSDLIGRILVLRSCELVAFAYENNILKDRDTLRGALYAVKYEGCSVSSDEIEDFWRKVP